MYPKLNLIDVGAVGGYDLPWRYHEDKINFTLSFEPNEVSVFKENFIQYNTAVWDFDGQKPFYVIGAMGEGSSLLPPNVAWVSEHFQSIRKQGNPKFNDTWFERAQVKKTSTIDVKKLDTVLTEINQQLRLFDKPTLRFDFLKSDTQSGEYYVLQGAENFLKNDCLGLELELFRYPMYEGVVTENEVVKYLNELGFEEIGWTGYLYSFHCSCDRLFVRKQARNSEEESKIKLIKSIYNPQGKDKIIKKEKLLDNIIRRIKKNRNWFKK